MLFITEKENERWRKREARALEADRSRPEISGSTRSSWEEDEAQPLSHCTSSLVRFPDPSRIRSLETEYGCTLGLRLTSQCSRQSCARNDMRASDFPERERKRKRKRGRKQYTHMFASIRQGSVAVKVHDIVKAVRLESLSARETERNDFGKLSRN